MSRLHSSIDSCSSPPWLLSPGVPVGSPALSPLWTGSGLPPPPSWPGLRPSATVQRSVSSASSRAKPVCYAGWTSDDKFCPAAARTRHTANSQPTMSTPRGAMTHHVDPTRRSGPRPPCRPHEEVRRCCGRPGLSGLATGSCSTAQSVLRGHVINNPLSACFREA